MVVDSASGADVAAMDRLADRFFAAIEQGDMRTLASLYTADAVVWHNTDKREQPQAENVAMLATLSQLFSSLRYANVRRRFFDGGFVQQHDARITARTGERCSVAVCMVVIVREGKVARIDEYLDGAQLPGFEPAA
jgi:ketosteroid isomerase-like protein